jgi:hypothetical protein
MVIDFKQIDYFQFDLILIFLVYAFKIVKMFFLQIKDLIFSILKSKTLI